MTTQTDTEHTQPTLLIRADSPAALLGIVPGLIGFQPEASLVVIGTTGPRHHVKVTLRYDLTDQDPVMHAIHAMGVLRGIQASGVAAVIYGTDQEGAAEATAILAATTAVEIKVLDVLRVEGQRFWSYICDNLECCPAEGQTFDANPTDLGHTVLADRAALAASIAPLTGDQAEAMRQATRRAEQHLAQLLTAGRKDGSRIGAARRIVAATGLAEVGALIARYRDDGAAATDDEIATVTVMLRDLRVRDDAWAKMDPEHGDAHRRMWTDVVRRAQPGYVAGPASLLAFVAWQLGDGALANVALDRAMADDPRYSMAGLLRQVITAGAPPSLARLPMTPEEVAASYDEIEDPDDDAEDPDQDDDSEDPDAG